MKHGLYQHPLYKIWSAIQQRCCNPKMIRYKDWGGRGIKLCGEWLHNPEMFIKWALENGYKKGLQIDRINNDGNYTPDNCRFVTPAENMHNKRDIKLNWDMVNEIRNAKLLIPELTYRELGVAYNMHCTTILDIIRNISWVDGC